MRWRQNVGKAVQEHPITRCFSRQLSRAGSAASHRVEDPPGESRGDSPEDSAAERTTAEGGAPAVRFRSGDGASGEGAAGGETGVARPILSRHAQSMGPDGEVSGEADGGRQRQQQHAMRRALSDVTGFEA